MWTLTPPENINHLDIIVTALTYHNGDPKHALTIDEKNAIANICQQYDRLEGKEDDNLKGLATLSEDSRNAMHDAYGEVQKRGRLSDYRSKLLLLANRCPCCGISAADELDHYLPRSIFKPLSLYFNNLIPLCHTCNNTKRTHHSTADERFLHAYFESVPSDERFFVADTSIEYGALIVTFSAIKTPGLSVPTLTMINFQMGKVNLNERLKAEVNIFLASYSNSIEGIYEVRENADDVKEFMLKESTTHAKRFGLNDWRTALVYSLANNIKFCRGGFRIVIPS
ncbi:HNH endonuclease [Aeromonas rivuli]|uniref:HNH endonuclease n=1 Tax=Aeromonas rivuli TaxID=648794 RepID=UPI001CC90AF2|nr:HNH endonuclease signature motif containing protein [Aeromonas rivuli]UBO72804.1 HNH endonuclease [Aeromonas rivuli]